MITGFAFTKIIVADIAAMERFYCDGLGMTVKTKISVDEPGWVMRETILVVGDPKGTMLNLVQFLERPCPPPGEAVIGLAVTDVDAVLAAAVSAGGTIVTPAVELPEHGCKIAYVGDPEGHLLELLQSLG